MQQAKTTAMKKGTYCLSCWECGSQIFTEDLKRAKKVAVNHTCRTNFSHHSNVVNTITGEKVL